MQRMLAVPPAAIVHATAALHLDLGGRELRDALAIGYSLADIAEWRDSGLGGLRQAILGALRRTRAGGEPTDEVLDRVVHVAADGWNAWQALVDSAIAPSAVARAA